ncbi:hypothetical protein KL924_000677 [Ogataea haglerorum]|nr:hypothetical protein KL924_000677 [Ogataea haglerorum]
MPVKFGGIALTAVFAKFTVPITFGSSSEVVTDERRIWRGITSNAVKVWLRSRKTDANARVLPNSGMQSRASPQGTCVRMDDLTGPTCLANHADGIAASACKMSSDEKMAPRVAAGASNSFARTASSIDLNGPVSLPDGEITPNTEATRSRPKLSVPDANTAPDASINKLPSTIMRRLPILFEFHTKMYDSRVSPIMVSDMNRPIRDSLMCNSLRYNVSTWLVRLKDDIRTNTENHSTFVSELAWLMLSRKCTIVFFR